MRDCSPSARELPCHVLLIHHAPKGSDSRDAIDAPLGSTSIAGTVDVILHLKRADERRLLTAVYRDGAGQDFPETVVTLDKTTGAITLGPTRAEADEQAAGDAILAYLRTQTEPVDEPTIRDHVEGSNLPKVRALRRLVEARRVTRRGAGKKGDPYLYAITVARTPVILPKDQSVDQNIHGVPFDPDTGTIRRNPVADLLKTDIGPNGKRALAEFLGLTPPVKRTPVIR